MKNVDYFSCFAEIQEIAKRAKMFHTDGKSALLGRNKVRENAKNSIFGKRCAILAFRSDHKWSLVQQRTKMGSAMRNLGQMYYFAAEQFLKICENKNMMHFWSKQSKFCDLAHSTENLINNKEKTKFLTLVK